jgi:hypothetical protein
MNTPAPAPPDDGITKMGLLMEAAIAYQQSAEDALKRLNAHTRGMDAIVRDEIRRTLTDELMALGEECGRAKRALESVKRAANVRILLWSIGITVVCTGIALTVLWKLLPTKSEIAALREQRDRYSQTLAQLESRGGRIDLRRCGEANARLCVHVDPKAPAFGEHHDYMVVQGY